MKMFEVPSNIAEYMLCSSKLACSTNPGAMITSSCSAIWYSCPVCSYRVCPACVWISLETPPPLYDTLSQKSMEDNRSTIEDQERLQDKKQAEEHDGASPVPGMVE